MVTDGHTLPTEGLLTAFRSVLRPLARLAVATGLPYARIDEVLRQVLVEAASAAHPGLPPERRVSRISTTLGLNRREVTRLHRATEAPPPAPPSHATRLFLKWHSDARFRDADGLLLGLPRQGSGLSFEKLAHEITRDVHPRSLLGELCRLGLARHDEERDTVELIVEAFVPRGDGARMLGFLGANVGDHFEAAVSNVLGDGREHFEQAIFADELSAESIEGFRDTITRLWQALRLAAVPALESLIALDRSAGRTQDQRIRIGLFSWNEPMLPGTVPPGASRQDDAAPAAAPGATQDPAEGASAPGAARDGQSPAASETAVDPSSPAGGSSDVRSGAGRKLRTLKGKASASKPVRRVVRTRDPK